MQGLDDVQGLSLHGVSDLPYGCASGAGQVFCWGDDSLGELGDGRSSTQECGIFSAAPVAVPGPVNGMMPAAAVAVGDGAACAYGGLPNMWCWGHQPGFGTRAMSPVEMPGTGESVQVGLGDDFMCTLGHDGSVACWGENTYGQLGNGQMSPAITTAPQVVLQNAEQIAVGGVFACALQSDGGVACWGDNSNGNVGLGTDGTDVLTPARVPGLPPAASIAAGPAHVCAITRSQQVWCWGANESGQIGNGFSGPDVKSPTQVVWNVQ